MIEAIRRASRLGYKLTFSPSSEGVMIQCREYPERRPCSSVWLCRTGTSDEDAVVGVNMLMESLQKQVAHLLQVPKGLFHERSN